MSGRAKIERVKPGLTRTLIDVDRTTLNTFAVMAARDPSRFGYLTRLSYETHTPAFLVKLQNRVAGVADDDDDDDDEFEDDGSGRPPIPKRPPIPQRPRDQPGSADEDEDEGDEKPQVVVLKGKHLTAREVENERRKRASSLLTHPTMSGELRGD